MNALALVKLAAYLAAAALSLVWLFAATGQTAPPPGWVPAAAVFALVVAVIPLPPPSRQGSGPPPR